MTDIIQIVRHLNAAMRRAGWYEAPNTNGEVVIKAYFHDGSKFEIIDQPIIKDDESEVPHPKDEKKGGSHE